MARQDQERNPDQAIQARIQALLDSQNKDGGWGYAPGGVSWTEPTVLAILALHGHPFLRHVTQPAFNFVRSLQRRDGGFRPCKAVDEPNWTTALAVAMHAVRRVDDACFSAGVRWLTMHEGAEGGFFNWLAGRMGRTEVVQDNTLNPHFRFEPRVRISWMLVRINIDRGLKAAKTPAEDSTQWVTNKTSPFSSRSTAFSRSTSRDRALLPMVV
ncbi:MAG: terpene cyclase/mutase family protein [Acidobacteria bacterium]|nr:terpene cyclase/mutase family protein [Acidobacteriota bacterium]